MNLVTAEGNCSAFRDDSGEYVSGPGSKDNQGRAHGLGEDRKLGVSP